MTNSARPYPDSCRTSPRRMTGRRHGVSSVLAMLYLILFSAMSVGFYAAVTTAATIGTTDTRVHEAQATAESGVAFVRYHLASLDMPSGLDPDKAFEECYMQLAARLDGTGNLNGGLVGYTAPSASGPGVISIPDGNGFVSVGGRQAFRAVITQKGQLLTVKIIAQSGGMTTARAVETDFAVAQNASNIFDYGVASRSSITLDGNARITGASVASLGSVLSTTKTAAAAISLGSNASISGDVSLSDPEGIVIVAANASIAGSKNSAVYSQNIHKGVPEPEFPTIDTRAFEPFATNILSEVGKKYDAGVLRNIRIKAGTNPEFSSNMEVEGVIYVETPNRVTFSSNTTIRGVIVAQNNPTGTPGTGVGQNMISMSSNVKLYGVETLPATADFPPALRALKGAAILAPKFYLHFNSNFGSVGGSIIGSQMEFDSNASGTIKGSVINMDDTAVNMNSNAVISIESQGTAEYPAGVFFGYHYAPLTDTYREVKP